MEKNIVIFAPHCDDELIGCYLSLIFFKVKAIYYFFELSDERKTEALACAEKFKTKAVFLEEGELPTGIDSDTLIYVPNIADFHECHKFVNLIAKTEFPNNKKKYYSVDMNVEKLSLSPKAAEEKEIILRELYPSQSKYFDSNPKCYLFESLLQDDIETTITISTQFEGFHSYPMAPDEVAFLRNEHRHIFHVDVTIQVAHDDREIEFFMLKREVDEFIKVTMPRLENKSCEMIGRSILNYLLGKYPNRNKYSIHVSEDRENGATVTFKVR